MGTEYGNIESSKEASALQHMARLIRVATCINETCIEEGAENMDSTTLFYQFLEGSYEENRISQLQ